VKTTLWLSNHSTGTRCLISTSVLFIAPCRSVPFWHSASYHSSESWLSCLFFNAKVLMASFFCNARTLSRCPFNLWLPLEIQAKCMYCLHVPCMYGVFCCGLDFGPSICYRCNCLEWHAQKLHNWPPMMLVQLCLMLMQDKKQCQRTSLPAAVVPTQIFLVHSFCFWGLAEWRK